MPENIRKIHGEGPDEVDQKGEIIYVTGVLDVNTYQELENKYNQLLSNISIIKQKSIEHCNRKYIISF